MNHNNISFFNNATRVVVKVGSGVLTLDHGLNLDVIKSITKQICMLIENGIEVFLVSSGAMASGIKRIGLVKRPDDIPQRQAAAAVGQAGLIIEYEKAFSMFNKKVAQILLTGEDLSNPERYLNAQNTFNMLLSWKVVPIINENDTVAVDEIKFGDNDNLAAIIAMLMNVDILIKGSPLRGSNGAVWGPDGKIYLASVWSGAAFIVDPETGDMKRGMMRASKRIIVAFLMLVLASLSGYGYADETGGIDVILVMDSSGSMKKTDPMTLRIPAARLFLSLLGKHDRAGVVSFSDKGYPLMQLMKIDGND